MRKKVQRDRLVEGWGNIEDRQGHSIGLFLEGPPIPVLERIFFPQKNSSDRLGSESSPTPSPLATGPSNHQKEGTIVSHILGSLCRNSKEKYEDTKQKEI